MAQIGVAPAPAESGSPAASPEPLTWTTLFDRDGAIVSQNGPARAGFRAAADARGSTCAFIRHFVDRAEGRRLLAEAGAGATRVLETLLHTAAGKARCRIEISPLDGGAGIMLLERPERPEETEAAPQPEAGPAEITLLRAALTHMHQGFLVTDKEARVVLWNERFLEMNGLTSDAIEAGMPGLELIRAAALAGEYGPGDVEELTARRAAEMNGGSEVVTRRRPNGRMIDFHTNRMPTGNVIRTYTDITDARHREQEIAEKGVLLAATLESMDQGIMVLDAEARVRMWNRRLVDLHGLPADFLKVGLPAGEIIHQLARQGEYGPGDCDRVAAERLAGLAREQGPVFARRHANGLLIERRRRTMPGGGAVLTFTDITALSEREHALEENGALLAATLASMDQGMLVLDPELRIRTWNGRLGEMLDLPPELPQVGMMAGDLLRRMAHRACRTPDETEREIAHRLGEFRGGNVRVLEGPEFLGRVLERRSRPMPDGGLVVTYSDVTGRKRREDELAENGTLLAVTLDNMDQGLIVIDAEHRAKLWNNRLVDMFNVPPDVLRIGRPFAEIMRYFIETAGTPPEDVEPELAARLVELEQHPVPILERHRPDGRVIERRRRLMPVGGSVITYGDVTERRHSEAALRRAKEEAEIASRSKTEFLANMSHELRTPLNAIIGFADILARQIFGPLGQERYIEYAHDIRDSGQHLLNLINDVLDIAKIEVNKTELTEQPVSVPELVESCLRLMRDRANAGGITIATRLAPDLPQLRADDRRLKQILLNLISNAVKFTPVGGEVEIRAEGGADGFRFMVADTGIGIAAADIATALAPFGQIDSSLARRYQGTGLGLPLARSMTELHGGRLEIESNPGSGTMVTVWLPPERQNP
jgi:signal transduction histidine kinase